ncbi:MAG: molecular chaperone [Chitinophagaceae bacterium]|nr:MAG: molecular chaperone [Chitinophagaceae bacterium]
MTDLSFKPLVAICFLVCSLVAKAQGDLLITPKRLVFDGTKRSEEVNLANIGKDTTTYSISFVQYKMDEKGLFTAISSEDTSLKFADKNLRFFPRTVTLAPNEAQTIKVQLIKANELAPGEYRSHLFFKNVLNTTALGEEAKPGTPAQGISVSIKPVFGISIATIIRIGETNVTGSLSNVKFTPATPTTDPYLQFSINRSGNISLYGDISVQYVDANNKSTEVALMKGVAVYTPNAFRLVKLPLKQIQGMNYNSGKLVVVFSDPAARNSTICKTELVF